jgi:hypothetical protein
VCDIQIHLLERCQIWIVVVIEIRETFFCAGRCVGSGCGSRGGCGCGS